MISEEKNIDLTPLNFTKEEINNAVNRGEMLALQAHFPAVCNYDCYYCYTKHLFKDYSKSSINDSFKLYESFLKQGKELGARTISIPGLGEPFLIPWFEDFLKIARDLNISVVLFTNGSLIEEKIDILLEHRPALYIKLNTLGNPHIMDEMCGITNSWNKSINGIKLLVENNYQSDSEHLIGIETVVMQENFNQIPQLYKWCRENHFIPLVELPMPFYNSKNHNYISNEQEVILFENLSEIDKDYGFEWKPKPPFAGTGCSFHLISLCMYPDGSLHPCSGIKLDNPYGNISKNNLVDVWHSKRVQSKVQRMQQLRKSNPDHSYGCRAYAYRKTGDMFANDSRVNFEKLKYAESFKYQ